LRIAADRSCRGLPNPASNNEANLRPVPRGDGTGAARI